MSSVKNDQSTNTTNVARSFQLNHQVLSLTGINFSTRSIIGKVELTLYPTRENVKHIRLNAKQCKIYRVCLNGKIEAPFQYFDPTLEVCQDEAICRNLDAYSEAHTYGCRLVDANLNGGELNIRIPPEAHAEKYIALNKPLKVCVDFSIVDPQGGLRFVVPGDQVGGRDPNDQRTMAEKAAHLFSCGNDNSNRLWFPCLDISSELCTWKLEFTVDEDMTAVSCGDLVDVTNSLDNKRKTFHYNVNKPTSAPNIGLAVGPFEITADPSMNELTYFCLPHLTSLIQSTVCRGWIVDAFEFMESTLGCGVVAGSSFKMVFVDQCYIGCPSDANNLSGIELPESRANMSILSTNLLHSSPIIDQTYITRYVCAQAVALQFFSAFINAAGDWASGFWLKTGIASYLAGLFYKKTFGNNAYRMLIYELNEYVIDYERRFGGIVLDPTLKSEKSKSTNSQQQGESSKSGEGSENKTDHPSSTSLNENGGPKTGEKSGGSKSAANGGTTPVNDNLLHLHFSPLSPHTTSPSYGEALVRKAHLVIRMVELRIGQIQLMQVLNKLLTLANNAATVCQDRMKKASTSYTNRISANQRQCMLISSQSFMQAIFKVTGKLMTTFFHDWVQTGGHAIFTLEFIFNRKRNTIEFQLHQEHVSRHNHHKSSSSSSSLSKGVRKYQGPINVALQELDGWFTYTFPVEGLHTKHDINCHSKSRRNKKKKIPLSTQEEVDMDLSYMGDSPVLWIRVDPDMQLIRHVEVRQPDFQWQFQLRYERDVIAQHEAALALARYPSLLSHKTLVDVVENEKGFYRVRCISAHCLARVANALALDGQAPDSPALLLIFKKMFSSYADSNIAKHNDFTNLQAYFLQKCLPVAMAKLRNSHGICPPEVFKFILDLFKYNDNSKNTFSDNYYRAALVDALTETITPVASVLGQAMFTTSNDPMEEPMRQQTSNNISQDTKLILEEITRYLNMEKLLPSYRFVVSCACLRAIQKLQQTGHLMPNPTLFQDYADSDQFIDIRITAMTCLVEYIKTEPSSFDQLMHLINLIECDADLLMRHLTCQQLIRSPPFQYDRKQVELHPSDQPQLALKLWKLMNCNLWYDNRLRCDVVDLYAQLYGRRHRPKCVPSHKSHGSNKGSASPQKCEKVEQIADGGVIKKEPMDAESTFSPNISPKKNMETIIEKVEIKMEEIDASNSNMLTGAETHEQSKTNNIVDEESAKKRKKKKHKQQKREEGFSKGNSPSIDPKTGDTSKSSKSKKGKHKKHSARSDSPS